MTEKEKSFLKLHAIQLSSISVTELYLRTNQFPDPSVKLEFEDVPILVGYSENEKESNYIRVSVKIEIGMEEDSDKSTPYSLRVELLGDFIVDEN